MPASLPGHRTGCSKPWSSGWQTPLWAPGLRLHWPCALSFERFVQTPGASLRYLAKNDLLSACEPMPVDVFVRFCTDRGLRVTAERLEALERLGIFYPLLRVRYPQIQIKIERLAENRIRHHGMLRDGETWDGELQEESSRLSWRSDWISSWIDEGHVWDPRTRPFLKWRTFRTDDHEVRIHSFYSIFQCYPLRHVLTRLTCKVWLEQFGEADGDEYRDGNDFHVVGADLQKAGNITVDALRQHRRGEDAAILAQILSARYYFHTQGDRRTITVPSPDFDGWDWWKYSQTWTARTVAEEIGITPDEVKDIHRDVEFLTTLHDPLEHWYALVSFAALPKKEKLKGDALWAQLGYSIEHMLRSFYRDLTEEALLPPGQQPGWGSDNKYGAGVAGNPLRHLEFLVNEYNLNPRPKAILLVEGVGEAAEIPRLASHFFGSDFGVVGIEVRALGSVDEFTGDKKMDVYGALEKLIDDYHARQTIVFIVLDNENRAPGVRTKLLRARSRIVPKRMLTKPEYVHLWERTFEFDNFTDVEIATAMSKVAEARYVFTELDVRTCREKWDVRPADHLSALYRDKLQYGLNKRSMMAQLVDGIIENRLNEFAETSTKNRPIFTVLNRIRSLALLNHQPDSQEGWQANQESGYFGDYEAG